jgi:phosphatidylinositol alpha-1,6-mannosyltransferase
MERLNLNVLLALAQACEVSVCGPEGCAAHMNSSADVIEVPHRPLPLFLLRSLAGSLRLARRRRPDVVIAGSGLTAPIAWLIARLCAARFVVYLHGLDLVAANRIYQLLWLPVIRRADIALVNSRHTASLAQQRGMPIAKISILHPGTELPIPDQSARQRFRESNNLGERPLLLSVGRLTPRKGLAEFIERSLPGIVEACPGAQLLVIGDDAVDAVRATRGSERSRIQQAAENAGVLGSVRFMPPCDESVLSDAYQAADVYVFPVREIAGDIEGFGMVAIEAAAHGLSTVAFRVGGVADAVIEGRSGELVAPGDYAGFADAVVRMLRPTTGASLRSAECRSAATAFGWDRFGGHLRTLLSLEPPAPRDKGDAG